MAKKFRMKQEPVQPKRNEKIENKSTVIESYGEPTVAKLMDTLSSYPLDGKLEFERSDPYDPDSRYDLVVTFLTDESDESFAKRMANYEKRLAAYVEWFEENQTEIKKKEEEDKKLKEGLKGKEIKKLEKRLSKLRE